MIAAAEIRQRVAATFQVKVSDLTGHRVNRVYARPRQVGMYVTRLMRPDLSYPWIGNFYDRDHSTAIHAFHRIGKLIETDPLLAAAVREIVESFQCEAA